MAEYDELVKRLKDAAYGDHERGCPARSAPACACGWDASSQLAAEEAAAAIQALQQRGQWRLKPLEWVEEKPGLWQARNDLGRYWYYVNEEGFFWTSYDREETRADSLEAARAGAEAAYADDVREAYFLPHTT